MFVVPSALISLPPVAPHGAQEPNRLGSARETAQWAAIFSREFSDVLLQAVLDAEAPRLASDLRRLTEAELIAPIAASAQDVAYLLTGPGTPSPVRYAFKHALIQEAAYASLPKRTRQAHHRRVAETIEARFLQLAELRPELLARHCAIGDLPAKAVDYYLRAAARAYMQGATLEAKTFCNQAFDMLPKEDHTSAVGRCC